VFFEFHSNVNSWPRLFVSSQELHAQWEKKYAERKSAIQKEWTNITTALSLGGEPSAGMYDER